MVKVKEQQKVLGVDFDEQEFSESDLQAASQMDFQSQSEEQKQAESRL